MSESVRFQAGQSFRTFEELKMQLEARAASKREDFSKPMEERITYFDIAGNEIGSVLAGTEYKYSGGGIVPPKKEDVKNNGMIEIGKTTYYIPVIRDGKGGQVNKIVYNYKTIAIDKDGDGLIGEDELIINNTNNQ